MDLERIKQNLRLRSGRPRKSKKPPARPIPQTPKQAAPNSVVTSDPPVQVVNKPTASSAKGKKEEPPKSIETKNVPAYRPVESQSSSRPQLPHAATGLMNGYSRDGPPDRYGRSGIEKPKGTSEHAPPPPKRTMTDPHHGFPSDMSDDGADFDLRPPAPRPKPVSLEATSELLFSAGHLNAILQEPQSVAKFAAFLHKYKPEFQPLILRYLESQKAIKAVEYANAIAEGAASEKDAAIKTPSAAAILDRAFEDASAASFKSLVGTALPMYVTYRLIKLVTECLVNEVTGKQTPMMRNLVGGLSEVFCLTDPNQEDNPIIYASEEFYRLTGYDTDDVIGHNCRFLQGSKTNTQSPLRLRQSIEKGEEHCETLLNYRRDGRPFINLLMIAPLHDNHGKVKYNIGAQVDVSGLVERGRGLEDFDRYLQVKKNDRGRRRRDKNSGGAKSKALQKLQELSEMFDLEESAVVQSHSRASSISRDDDTRSIGSSERRQRRVLVSSDHSDPEQNDDDENNDGDAWKLAQVGPSGPSGKLPGVYDSYMLLRAGSSLRIIFVSSKLRKIGNVIQRPFLSHVAASATTLKGLKESFNTGVLVSAKINFMKESSKQRDGTQIPPGTKLDDGKYGRTCWISATPLLGSDDQVGVWMVVVVEKSKVRHSMRTAEVKARMDMNPDSNKSRKVDVPGQGSPQQQKLSAPQFSLQDLPIKPNRLNDLPEDLPNYEDGAPELRTGPEVNEKHPDESNKPVKSPSPTPEEDDIFNIDHHTPDKHHSTPRDEPAEESSETASPPPEADRKYTPPPAIPAHMLIATPPPKTPNFEINDATPTRARFDEVEEERYDGNDGSPTTRLASRHLPNDMQPMDYLRHPGTGGTQEGRDGDKWTDADCKSPYSVD